MKSILVILRRTYLELVNNNHCAAKLIEYFKHWREWKLKHHRTDWIYQPLKEIYEDLMGEHSLHVIRRAIALLEELGFLKRRHNPGNGQDKTYQYQLQVEVIDSLLPESRISTEESPLVKNEPREFNVEQHTQISSTDSNLNITSSEHENVEKSLAREEPENLVEKYYEKLKYYSIYPLVWTGDQLIKNPRFEPILRALKKFPRSCEQSIQAFLMWIRTASRVEDRYLALESAVLKGWK